jgi:hypothetical protein
MMITVIIVFMTSVMNIAPWIPTNQPEREDSQFVPAGLEDCIHSIHAGDTFMTYLRRVAALLPFSVLFIAPGVSGAQQLPPVAEQMAKTYGLDSFGRVEAIRYTFTIVGLVPPATWEWQPKTDTVTYEGKDKQGNPMKVTYKRSELDSQSDAVKTQIDPAFVIGQYWLLLPLHVAWDGASVTDEGIHETPLAKAQAQRIVVKYAPSGYSPGDTWELYVGPDKRIVEMTYHRAVPVPKFHNLVNAKWEGYKKAGPLLFSTEHHGTADGQPFEVSLTDVAVKMVGSDKWVNAQSASEQAASERIARK